jgi:uncharacterized membrane protein YcjF (UPF0283 family)
MNDKKPFTIELEEATPMPHPAEVEQISDVAPPDKISMSSGRGLGLFGWAVSLGLSLVFAYFAIGFWDFILAQFARNFILGWVLGGLAATFVAIILALIIREFFVIANAKHGKIACADRRGFIDPRRGGNATDHFRFESNL